MHQARPATQNELRELPEDPYFDREGNVRQTFFDQTIKLHYLPKNHPLMERAKKETEKAGCLKHSTGAVLVRENKIIGRGANAGKKMSFCLRVQKNCSTGEGYEYCRDPKMCHQIEHAEVMAILDAVKKIAPEKELRLLNLIQKVNKAVYKNKNLSAVYKERNQFIKKEVAKKLSSGKNLSLVLYGHWWCCHSCASAMLSAGISNLCLLENARTLFDSVSPENILPNLDRQGRKS